MNKLIILALIFALGACNVKKVQHHQDTKSVLAEIDKDKFGSTFLSMVALNLAAKEPADEIALLLDEVLAAISELQAKAEEKNQTDQAICDETLGGFLQQIDQQTETIDSLTKAIRDNNEILEQAKIDLTQANGDYDETVEAIDDGTEEREEQHSKWTEADYEESVQVATLEEGVKLIQHMIHGVAFAQIKSRYEKVLEKLASHDGKRTTLFKPLISSLTQLATKLNYENVMKILDLLQSIRASILEDQSSARVAEERDQSDWETLLNHLENQKQSLSDKKQRLNNLIDSTVALLAQLSESLENHNVELENLQSSAGAQGEWCEAQSVTFVTESAERDRELDTLTQVLDHFQERQEGFEEFLQKRGTAL